MISPLSGARVAYVEDDPDYREDYSRILEKHGFLVTTYTSKGEAISGFEHELPDLALLDLSLDRDTEAGFDLCAALRRQSQTLPIVFFTSSEGELNEISGRRLGADDYIVKGCAEELLIVRIKSLLKRQQVLLSAGQFQSHGLLRYDLSRDQATWDGQPVTLSLTNLWIVKCLISPPGQVCTVDDLMKAARTHTESNAIAQRIRAIRETFRSLDAEFNCIETVFGKGYRWVDKAVS
jgi:two-component system, OmpR family, response regulator